MKTFTIILSMVIGSAAQAEYKVGDFATYATSMDGQQFDLKEEVLALDINTDSITIRESMMVDGATVQSSDGQGKISETAQNEQMFDACLELPAQFNPHYTMIQVQAGSFNTCHLTMTDQSGATTNAYFGQMIFGVVKLTKENSLDGSDVHIELKEFKKN